MLKIALVIICVLILAGMVGLDVFLSKNMNKSQDEDTSDTSNKSTKNK